LPFIASKSSSLRGAKRRGNPCKIGQDCKRWIATSRQVGTRDDEFFVIRGNEIFREIINRPHENIPKASRCMMPPEYIQQLHREVSSCLVEGVAPGEVGVFPAVDGAAALRLPELQIRMSTVLFYRPRLASASATFMVKSGLGFIWKRFFSLF
jgi:hypothetical protein